MYYTALQKLLFISICVIPEDNHTELIQILDYWVQFGLKISLRLCCGVNFVKKYRWCHVVVKFLARNVVGVMLLVKILPGKNCIVIVVWLRTHIAILWYRVFKVLSCCIMVLFSLVLYACARFCTYSLLWLCMVHKVLPGPVRYRIKLYSSWGSCIFLQSPVWS